MRAKYKIGNLVKTKETEDTASTIGVIDSIVTRSNGVTYILSDEKTEVREEDIEASYTERKPRQPRKSGIPRKAKAPKAA